jgi:hypothetical protein
MLAGVRAAAHRLERPQRRIAAAQAPKIILSAAIGVLEHHLMKNLLITLSLACSAGLAFAHGCPKEMAAIDARMATNPKLSDADKAKVQKLRADGEAAHKAGKHDDSMKLLAEAKKTLGI